MLTDKLGGTRRQNGSAVQAIHLGIGTFVALADSRSVACGDENPNSHAVACWIWDTVVNIAFGSPAIAWHKVGGADVGVGSFGDVVGNSAAVGHNIVVAAAAVSDFAAAVVHKIVAAVSASVVVLRVLQHVLYVWCRV